MENIMQIEKEDGLGFKDLKAFNLAMLGKQCWRLLHKEHSLFHKVFKTKYFRYGSFLNAGEGTNPSWAQRSLLEGCKVIERGAKWKVGNGESISILSDPSTLDIYPFSVRPEDCHNQHLILVKQAWLRQFYKQFHCRERIF